MIGRTKIHGRIRVELSWNSVLIILLLTVARYEIVKNKISKKLIKNNGNNVRAASETNKTRFNESNKLKRLVFVTQA